jgi:hypothetical protein
VNIDSAAFYNTRTSFSSFVKNSAKHLPFLPVGQFCALNASKFHKGRSGERTYAEIDRTGGEAGPEDLKGGPVWSYSVGSTSLLPEEGGRSGLRNVVYSV